MATKLLSLYFLVIAGLGVVRTAPLILDQRQEGSNGELGQLPSNQLGKIFNATDFPVNVMSVAVKRAAPLILDQRQDDGINSSGPPGPETGPLFNASDFPPFLPGSAKRAASASMKT